MMSGAKQTFVVGRWRFMAHGPLVPSGAGALDSCSKCLLKPRRFLTA